MRVLIINCVSDRPEIALYKGLKDAGLDLELIVDPRETRQAELREYGIPTEELFIKNRFDFSSIRRIREKLRSEHSAMIEFIQAVSSCWEIERMRVVAGAGDCSK